MSHTLNAPGTKNAAFAEFCGCDPSTLRPVVRLAYWHQFQAGTPAPGQDAARLHAILTQRHGADQTGWPALERSKLSRLEGPPAPPPKPAPPTSVADLARESANELAKLEKQLADAQRVRPGDTQNMRAWRDREASVLRDRIAGIRRRWQS